MQYENIPNVWEGLQLVLQLHEQELVAIQPPEIFDGLGELIEYCHQVFHEMPSGEASDALAEKLARATVCLAALGVDYQHQRNLIEEIGVGSYYVSKMRPGLLDWVGRDEEGGHRGSLN